MKKLRLSKALTIPEGISVSDACKRMAVRRVDAVLLTDANALLSGIVTDKVLTIAHCLHFSLSFVQCFILLVGNSLLINGEEYEGSIDAHANEMNLYILS